MDAHDLLGTYETPHFKYGDSVMCEVRGEVVIIGLTTARIPWPIARRPGIQALPGKCRTSCSPGRRGGSCRR